jgi:hypothetical protein
MEIPDVLKELVSKLNADDILNFFDYKYVSFFYPAFGRSHGIVFFFFHLTRHPPDRFCRHRQEEGCTDNDCIVRYRPKHFTVASNMIPQMQARPFLR